MARNSKETAWGRHHCAMGRQTHYLVGLFRSINFNDGRIHGCTLRHKDWSMKMSIFLRVRSRLRPYDSRLVSADSSPLTLCGELDMTVVFPGLSCDVVASIESDGLLGTEALQSCLPHQGTGSWPNTWQRSDRHWHHDLTIRRHHYWCGQVSSRVRSLSLLM